MYIFIFQCNIISEGYLSSLMEQLVDEYSNSKIV